MRNFVTAKSIYFIPVSWTLDFEALRRCMVSNFTEICLELFTKVALFSVSFTSLGKIAPTHQCNFCTSQQNPANAFIWIFQIKRSLNL